MFIKDEVIITEHVRTSKKGKYHPYKRRKTVCRFVCDECEQEFVRDKGSIDPKRLSNHYHHVLSLIHISEPTRQAEMA